MTHFSKLYRSWIESKNLRPDQAAPLLGVSIATSYKYVNGESLPPATRIPHLASCLGLSVLTLRKVITNERAQNRKRGAK